MVRLNEKERLLIAKIDSLTHAMDTMSKIIATINEDSDEVGDDAPELKGKVAIIEGPGFPFYYQNLRGGIKTMLFRQN